MTKLKLQKAISLILFSFLSLISFMSCNDNEEETVGEIDETISYAKIVQSDLQGWDNGFVKDNDIYTFYKDIDEEGYRFLHFVSQKSKTEISVIFQQESIIGFSYDNKFYSISQNESQIIISGFDNEYITTDVIDLHFPNKKAINMCNRQTRADNIGCFDALMTARDFWGYVQTAQSLNENSLNQLWNDFFSDLGDAIANGLISKVLGNMAGSTSSLIIAPFDMVHGTIEQSVKNNAVKIYSESSVEISEIRKGSDGQLEIYVTLRNINTIPQYLYRYYEPETNETTRNRVYCGVVGRYSGLPTYHTHDKQFVTKEVEIPTDGSVSELYLMFALPSVGNGRTIKFRPYMKSTRIKNIWGDVDENFIRYGNSVDYTDVNGTILSVNKVEATPGTDDNNMPYIHFTYDVRAQIESLDNIEEWGVYVLNNDKSYLNYPSEFKAAKLEDKIRIDNLNFKYNEFEEIDFTSFYASKQVKLGVYYKMKNSQGVYDYLNYYYSTPQTYEFIYNDKPSIGYNTVSVLGTTLIGSHTYEDGTVVNKYQTAYTYEAYVTGSFWISDVSSTCSGGYTFDDTGSQISSWGWKPNCDGKFNNKSGIKFWDNILEPCTVSLQLTLRNGSTLNADNSLFIAVHPVNTSISIIGSRNIQKNSNNKDLYQIDMHKESIQNIEGVPMRTPIIK